MKRNNSIHHKCEIFIISWVYCTYIDKYVSIKVCNVKNYTHYAFNMYVYLLQKHEYVVRGSHWQHFGLHCC